MRAFLEQRMVWMLIVVLFVGRGYFYYVVLWVLDKLGKYFVVLL